MSTFMIAQTLLSILWDGSRPLHASHGAEYKLGAVAVMSMSMSVEQWPALELIRDVHEILNGHINSEHSSTRVVLL